MRTGLGWRSLDPQEAVSAVHEVSDQKELLCIAHEARCAEARRLAVLKTGDQDIMRAFALTDVSPLVRRRLVRELNDIEAVRKIADEDEDPSVRDAARGRLARLEA